MQKNYNLGTAETQCNLSRDEKRQASLTLILLAIIVILIAEGNAQLGIIIIIIIDTPTNVMEISNIDF